MGIYSTNRTYLTENYDVPVDESYIGITGALNAMIDIENNNHAIFESTIARDFRSAEMEYKGYDEATLIAFNEATVSGFIAKFKQMVMKIWEKIKGIFSTFLKKLESAIVKDNKKYVEKYGKEVRLKDLSKLKYKIQKRQDGFDQVLNLVKESTEWTEKANNLFKLRQLDKIKVIQEKINDGEYTEEVIKSILGGQLGSTFNNVELKDLPKEIHEFCFDTESEEEGLDDEIDDIIRVLKGDKTVSDIKKAQTSANKHFKKIIDNVNDLSKFLDKQAKGDKSEALIGNTEEEDGMDSDGKKKTKNVKYTFTRDVDGISDADKAVDLSGKTKADITTLMKACGTIERAVNTIETVHTNTITCFLNENKFNITQSRKLFNKAAAYNPKKAKNEAMQIYLDAVEEAAEYEISSLFEDYSI